MKRFFKLALWSVAVAIFGLAACTEDPNNGGGGGDDIITNPIKDASLSVKINSVSINGAKGAIVTEILNEVAYVVEPTAEAKEYTAEELFEQGTIIEVQQEDGTGAVRLNIEELADNTEYTLQMAGRLVQEAEEEGGAENIYTFESVAKATFTTSIRPVMRAEIIEGSQTYNSVKIKVTTANISRFGYKVFPAKEATAEGFVAPSPAIIFAEGTLLSDIAMGDTEVTINRLSVNTEYVVYIAGELAETEDFYEEVLKVEGIKTTNFDEDIRVYDIDYNSFKIDVKAPENLGNHVIKWGTTNLYHYNMNIVYGGVRGMPVPYAESINLNDEAYGNYFTESTTLSFSEEDSYKQQPNGEYTIYYDAMVPGQPQVVMMGEFRWGESGWGYGYYTPLFNFQDFYLDIDLARTDEDMYNVGRNQDKYWDEGAFFYNEIVQLKKPELLTKKIDVQIEARPDGVGVVITPEEGVDAFALYIENDEMHAQLLNLLNGEEGYNDHIQWFVTSYNAVMEGARTFYREEHYPNGSLRVELSDFYYEHAIIRDDHYRMHVVGLHDDDTSDGFMDGHIQNYACYEFQLTEATEPEPTFELTFVPELSNATTAMFNLRCTSTSTSKVTKAYYVANGERAWHQINGSCQALVDAYGAPIEGTEVDAINSPEGLNIPISTFPNERIYIAAKVRNIDGTRVYSSEPVISDIAMQSPSSLDLSALNALAGDWTATATICYDENQMDEAGNPILDANGNNITKRKEEQVQCKITIGGDQTYPETMPEDVIKIFEDAKVSREDALAYHEEFKHAVDAFNLNLRNNNQIICKGWGFDSTGYIDATYADAYELFSSADYSGAYTLAPIFDFGPKWSIQTDGTNFWVPFNTNTYFPLSSHTRTKTSIGNFWNEYYLIGASEATSRAYGNIDQSFKPWETGYYADGRFPVEISNGGNTITIKPVDLEVISYKATEDGSYVETGREIQTFYPNAGYKQDNTGNFYLKSRIISDIVLTRGYTEPVAPAVMKAATRNSARKIATEAVPSHQEIKSVAIPKIRTSFKGEGVKTHTYKVIDREEFDRRNIEYLNRLRGNK